MKHFCTIESHVCLKRVNVIQKNNTSIYPIFYKKTLKHKMVIIGRSMNKFFNVSWSLCNYTEIIHRYLPPVLGIDYQTSSQTAKQQQDHHPIEKDTLEVISHIKPVSL